MPRPPARRNEALVIRVLEHQRDVNAKLGRFLGADVRAGDLQRSASPTWTPPPGTAVGAIRAVVRQRLRTMQSISADIPWCPGPSTISASYSVSSTRSWSANASRSSPSVYMCSANGGPPVP